MNQVQNAPVYLNQCEVQGTKWFEVMSLKAGLAVASQRGMCKNGPRNSEDIVSTLGVCNSRT